MIASGFRLGDDASRDDGGRRLTMVGELDAHAAQRLLNDVGARLDALDHDVHVDVSGLQFVDSAGLRALVQVDAMVREAGHRLVLEGPTAPVRQVLRIADLDEHFVIRP